jgi:glycosyltransferase involved in cell wall biosynthesis
MAAEGRSVLVVIPAFNEEASVAAVVHEVLAHGYHAVVVDDGSEDDTPRQAAAAGAVVLRLGLNIGVGGALRCGFRYAIDNGYSQVVQCDGDGQHDPGQIGLLAAAASVQAADLLIGSRFSGTGGFEARGGRRIAMRALSRVATKAAGRPITDATSGFRLIREPLLSEFARHYPTSYLGDTFEVLVAAARAGYVVAEAPVTMRARSGGRPSAGKLASVRFLIRVVLVLLLRTSQPFRPRPAIDGPTP